MSITRLLGFTLLGPRWRKSARRIADTVDIAGGIVLLVIIGSVLLRGRPLAALILALIGIPVFLGTYRALPSWWRGYDNERIRH